MSELSYKELQEKGVFDVPYRAFEFMQQQQNNYNELENLYIQQGLNIHKLQQKIDDVLNILSKGCLKDDKFTMESALEDIEEILG